MLIKSMESFIEILKICKAAFEIFTCVRSFPKEIYEYVSWLKRRQL